MTTKIAKHLAANVRKQQQMVEQQRYYSMMEQHQRAKMERADAAYSEYLLFVGALAAAAEDATVEALKFFVPSDKEKRAIKSLPKQQRKQYIAEHWPYYRQETKQMMDSIDVSFFEEVAVKSANKLDRTMLEGVMDEATTQLKKHVYILRQSVKRFLGRVKDKDGKHIAMLEEKSYLYVAGMLWARVCACHDLRIKMGPTPVHNDRNEEVRQYISDWTLENHRRTAEGLPSLPSRYYDADFDRCMRPFRPTRIYDAIKVVIQRIIGYWHDSSDPRCADIVKSDEIIMQTVMSYRFIENLTEKSLHEMDKYQREMEWLDRYVQATGDNVAVTTPMLNVLSCRLDGKTATEDILELAVKRNRNVGQNMYNDICRVMAWIDTQLPHVESKTAAMRRDLKKMDQLNDLIFNATSKEEFEQKVEEIIDGDETLLQAFYETIEEVKELRRKEDKRAELIKTARLAHLEQWKREHTPLAQIAHTPDPAPAKDTPDPAPANHTPALALTTQPEEPRVYRMVWKDDDASWLYSVLSRKDMTIDEAAQRLGRTPSACYQKYRRMQKDKEREQSMKKPLRITKTS